MPYQCTHCSRTLRTIIGLSDHERIMHPKNTPHPPLREESPPVYHACPICGKRFPTLSQMKQHKSTHWKKDGEWNCGVCGRTLNSEGALRDHERDKGHGVHRAGIFGEGDDGGDDDDDDGIKENEHEKSRSVQKEEKEGVPAGISLVDRPFNSTPGKRCIMDDNCTGTWDTLAEFLAHTRRGECTVEWGWFAEPFEREGARGKEALGLLGTMMVLGDARCPEGGEGVVGEVEGVGEESGEEGVETEDKEDVDDEEGGVSLLG